MRCFSGWVLAIPLLVCVFVGCAPGPTRGIASSSVASAPAPAATTAPIVRDAGAVAAKLKVGMTEGEIDQIIRADRPGKFWDDSNLVRKPAFARRAFGDGSALILGFDTRDSRGNIDPDDRCTSIEVVRFEDLQPQLPPDLFDAVRAIHFSPSVGGYRFNPVALVRAVNALQPLGKEKALRALRAYAALERADYDRAWRLGIDPQRVFLIARTLLVRRDGQPQMPWMYIGATTPEVKPQDPDWPLFPLAVRDDVPFCLSRGYSLAGEAEQPEAHLDYCEKECVLRDHPLRPGDPLRAAEGIFTSAQWKRLLPDASSAADTKSLVRLQALRCLEPIISPSDAEHFFDGRKSDADLDALWQRYLHDPQLMHVRWNERSQTFEK